MIAEKYTETRVKKRRTGKDMMLRVLMIMGIILPFFLMGISGLFIIVSLAMVFVTSIFWKRVDIEYEYVFCDGQVDFDRIAGGESRKTLLRIDFDQLLICAPKTSHTLDEYTHKSLSVKDFTSLEKDRKVYGMVVNSSTGNGGMVLIYFEPDDNMIAAMKGKSPRKIADY